MSTTEGGGRIVTNGLISYYDAANPKSFISGSTIWYDLSGNQQDITLVNLPTFNSSNGGYLNFNGSNQYGTTTRLTEVTDYSVNVWCNVLSITVGGAIISFGTTGLTSNIQIGGAPNPFQFNWAFNATPATINTWVMLTGTKQGINETLYLNGSLFVSASNASAINDILGKTVTVGKRFDNVYLNCNISIVQIYNRPLSQQEILQNYIVTKSRFGK